jgi:hypothetical protein
MSVASISIQTIMTKTGTSPQSTPAQQANEREAADQIPVEAKRAPPPPGMGNFVDKVA